MKELHFVIVINPNVEHRVLWFGTDGKKVSKEWLLDKWKQILRAGGEEMFIFDGELYQFDHGNSKWIKQRWDSVVYE